MGTLYAGLLVTSPPKLALADVFPARAKTLLLPCYQQAQISDIIGLLPAASSRLSQRSHVMHPRYDLGVPVHRALEGVIVFQSQHRLYRS